MTQQILATHKLESLITDWDLTIQKNQLIVITENAHGAIKIHNSALPEKGMLSEPIRKEDVKLFYNEKANEIIAFINKD